MQRYREFIFIFDKSKYSKYYRKSEELLKNHASIVVPKLRIFIYLCKDGNVYMKRIFSKSTLREFWEVHSDSEQYLKTWHDTAVSSIWKTPYDVKLTFASASILKGSRIVFNIKGNTYRLVAKFNFEKQLIYVRFIETHEEYNKINANTI